MAESYTWQIQVAPAVPNVIARINYGASTFPTEAIAGEPIYVTFAAINIGSDTGNINWKLCLDPGTANEQVIDSGVFYDIAPNAWTSKTVSFTIEEEGTYTLGLKVWGEEETEPSW